MPPTSSSRDPVKRLLAARAPDLLVALWRTWRLRRFLPPGIEPTRTLIERQYRDLVGEPPDLDAPRGLSEKLNRMKLLPPNALQTACADKIRARDYVADRIGPEYLTRLILKTYTLADISPATIPDARFVIKSNHDFGGVLVCTDRDRFDFTAARLFLAERMAVNHWERHREPAYRGIRPGLLVEEYLEGDGPEGLREYKIFCFAGAPQFVMVVRDHAGKRLKTVMDLDWRRLPVARRRSPVDPEPIRRPERLTDLLSLASRLSAPFPFCRVDLYETRGRIVFGEMTFFPEGGNDVFDPPEWERRFGDLLTLPADPAARG